jgi:micrococcal nuclease
MWTYRATVKGIYDGDSITVYIDLGFGVFLHNQKIRLFGINAPEIRGEEREQGLISRDILRKWIPIDSRITLKTYKDSKEKYGRWLGEIFVPDEANREKLVNINEQLVAGGYAERYMD